MKRKLLCCAALVALCGGLWAAEENKIVVGEGDSAKTYELAKVEDAKAYVEAYADNVQADKDFRELLYTNRNHSIFGGNTRNHLLRQVANFFMTELK